MIIGADICADNNELPELGNIIMGKDEGKYGGCDPHLIAVDKMDGSPCNTVTHRKYRSYSLKDRLKAVSLSESGMGSIAIGREMNIDSSLIRGWIRRYKKDGIDGLRPRPYRKNLAVQQSPEIVERHDAMNSEEHLIKGYVQYVDNPIIVRSLVNALCVYGVNQDRITVGNDVLDFSRTMSSGDTLVINSLFDLSSDFSKMLFIIGELLKSGITIVSINDSGRAIKLGEINSLELVSLLKNYLSSAWNGIGQYDPGDNVPLRMVAKQTVKQMKEEKFAQARMLYEEGYSMAHAARAAGCSYNSFRYWYSNRKYEDR